MDNYIKRQGEGSEAEFICDHPKVDRIWLTGRMSAQKEALAISELNILLKDGSATRFEVGPISCIAGDFPEVEAYLQTL